MANLAAEARPILDALQQQPDDWQAIGRTLSDLERLSRATEAGASWTTTIVDELAKIGRAVTAGHVQKARRVYEFLDSGVRMLDLPPEYVKNGRLSTLELAERLHRLDSGKGYEALEACVQPRGAASLADIKALYEAELERHPERMSPRQAAWAARKVSAPIQTAKVVTSEKEDSSGGAPDELFREVEAIFAKLRAAISERDARIEELEDELAEEKIAHDRALQDFENLRLSTQGSYADKI